MRNTKALQLLSLAAAVAAPTVVCAAAPSDIKRLSTRTDSLTVTSDAGVATVGAQNLQSSSGGQLPQLNNNAFWSLLGSGVWSVNSNWSTGAFPNDPTDSATFITPGILNGGLNVSLDAPRTIGTLTFNSEFQHNIIPPGAAAQETLTISTGQITASDSPNGNFNTITLGHAVRTNIAGSSGLTKLGGGAIQLSPTAPPAPGNVINSTFTGGVNISAGRVSIAGDSSFGALSNNVSMSNNTELVIAATTAAATVGTDRNFTLTGQTNFILFNDYTIGALGTGGVISGSGDLRKVRNTTQALKLAASNTYTGATVISDGGTVQVNGTSGAINSSSRIDIAGALTLGFGAGQSNTRIGNATPINFYGGALNQVGKATLVDETAGNVTLKAGVNRIYANDSTTAGQRAALHFGTLTRQNNATLFVRGNGLGAGGLAASGNATIAFSANPAGMIGGNGASGSTNISIIPYIAGLSDVSPSGANLTGVVTHNTTVGLRPLASNEYAASIGIGTLDNVRLTSVATLNAAASVNSLVLGSTNVSVGGGLQGTGTLTINSGQIVVADASLADPLSGKITTALTSPSEFVIFNSVASAELSGKISNGASGKGLTSAHGTMFITNPANDYTGPTNINDGFLVAAGNLPNNAPSALGNTNAPIVIRPGANSDVVQSTGNSSGGFVAGLLMRNTSPAVGAVVDRSIEIHVDNSVFTAAGTADLGSQNVDGDGAIVFNGGVLVDGGVLRLNSQAPTAALAGPNNPALSGLIFNGAISGGGRVSDMAYQAIAGTQNPFVNRFNGQNTYSNSTTIIASTFQLGSSSIVSGPTVLSGPLGTGTVHFTQVPLTSTTASTPGSLQAMDAPRTLANNILYRTQANFIGSQPLTLSGFQDMGSNIQTLNVTNSADTTISGVIGRGGFAKSGSGRLVLLGNNTFTSQAQLLDNGGVVAIGSNNALGGNTTQFRTNAGATFLFGNAVLETFNDIDSAETIFFSTPTAVATGNIRSTSGNNTLSGFMGLGTTQTIGVNANSTLNHTGTFSANTDTITDRAKLTKVGAGQLNVRALATDGVGTLAMGGAAINAGSLTVIANDGSVAGGNASLSQIGTLTIGGSAFVDLHNNDMILHAEPKASVELKLKTGYNFGGWDGQGGMTTSLGASTGTTALGMLDSAELLANAGQTVFDGVTVAPNDILVKYTYFGDVDFNGQVDTTDYNIIDFGFLVGLSNWANGDVDYNGQVDTSDYNLIDFAFLVQSGTLRQALTYLGGGNPGMVGMDDEALQMVIKHQGQFGAEYVNGMFALVPEPASIGVIALAGGALMGRRRRCRDDRATM